VEQRFGLLSGSRFHLIGNGTKPIAIEPRRSREFFRQHGRHRLRLGGVHFRADCGVAERSRGVVVEHDHQTSWDLIEPIDGRSRHCHRAREKFQSARSRRHLDSCFVEMPQRQLGDASRIGQLQIVPVRPRQLLLIEHAGAVPHRIKRKPASHLVDWHQLGGVSRPRPMAWRPADQRQIVHQRLGQVSFRLKFGNRGCAVALR
jgi:hypothetical protein